MTEFAPNDPQTPVADPSPQTMIGVDESDEQMEESTAPGTPLPVGAHAPERIAQRPTPAVDPPGLPEPPDDLDRTLADHFNALLNDVSGGYDSKGQPTRWVSPQEATLSDALREAVPRDGGVGPRAVLLEQVARHATHRRNAAMSWARAVREREEARLEYEMQQLQLDVLIDALERLGLLTEEDRQGPTGPVYGSRISDDMIVT